MKTLTQQLTQYAAYHRDPRNIATHFVGIPMIVLAVAVLLSRPTLFTVAAMPVTPACIVTLLTVLYYLKLDLRFGALMAAVMGLNLWAAHGIAQGSTALWLGCGIALFVIGWVIQFIGHVYEGRKPAFVDDITGLIIGPLFVLAEAVFAAGLRAEVLRAIEAEVGPVRRRDAQATARG